MVFSSEVVLVEEEAGAEEVLAAADSADLEAEASEVVDLAEAGRNTEKKYQIKKEKAISNLLFLCGIKFLSNHQ